MNLSSPLSIEYFVLEMMVTPQEMDKVVNGVCFVWTSGETRLPLPAVIFIAGIVLCLGACPHQNVRFAEDLLCHRILYVCFSTSDPPWTRGRHFTATCEGGAVVLSPIITRLYSQAIGVDGTVIQLNGSDLVWLLSLYCQRQLHTRSTRIFCPVAVTLNQQSTIIVGYYREWERLSSDSPTTHTTHLLGTRTNKNETSRSVC